MVIQHQHKLKHITHCETVSSNYYNKILNENQIIFVKKLKQKPKIIHT